MRTNLSIFSLLVLVVGPAGTCAGQSGVDDKRLAGYWSGNALGLPVILYLKNDAKGVMKWHFDSPFEFLRASAETSSSFDAKKGTLTIQFKIGSSFIGKLNKDGSEFKGIWNFGNGHAARLTLKRSDKMPFRRPQEPKPPFPYRSEDVRYDNKKAGNKLAGTLTLPKSGGPFPVVLLISGTGPDDRDESASGHKTFLVLADYLTRCGIAVLRFDDRGVGKSTGSFAGATTEDFANDVECGVEFLKARKDIDPLRIGLMGHSEGGTIASMVAAKSKDIAFIILLAGNGLPGEKIFYLQEEAQLKEGDAPERLLRQHRLLHDKLLAVLKAERDVAVAEKKLIQAMMEFAERLPESERRSGLTQELAQIQAKKALEPWPWKRFFYLHDPRPALRKVQCPVLAINGDKDVQVTHKENLSEIEKALKEGGNKDYTVKRMPGLNHRFQTCKTGPGGGYFKALGEYGKIEETVAPAALELIGDWIVSHTKK